MRRRRIDWERAQALCEVLMPIAAARCECREIDIVSGVGRAHVVMARRAICVTIRRSTSASTKTIGVLLGMDHSSVIYHYRRWQEGRDETLAQLIDDLTTAARAMAGDCSPFWTPERDEELARCWTQTTLSDGDIAARLGCPEPAVPLRATQLGLMSDDYPSLEGVAA